MVPIEPEPPAEPPAESGGLEGLALQTVLLPGEQTPARPRQTDKQRQTEKQAERDTSAERKGHGPPTPNGVLPGRHDSARPTSQTLVVKRVNYVLKKSPTRILI
eukprot:scaffold17203_cov55-Phaeocystis_antarctica.AAC.4